MVSGHDISGFACHAWYECHWEHGWLIGLAANAIISLAYLAIAYHIFSALRDTGQWGENTVGRATGAIFFTCGVGHGLIAAHLLLPTWGIEVVAGNAARLHWTEWHVWLWTPITAAVGVSYWLLRRRMPALVQGAALFEDLEARRRRALHVHDTVVQDLAAARRLLEQGEQEEATEQIETAMENARDVVAEYMRAEPGSNPEPGSLRVPTDTA